MTKILISLLGALTPSSALAFSGETPTGLPRVTSVSKVADFYDIIRIAANWLVVFGIIIGATFVVVGGIQYITAGGDEEGTKAAKAKIIGGLIGVAIVLLAFSLVNIVGSFFGTSTTLVAP